MKIAYIEICVGMAKLVAWWHSYALGFKIKGSKIYQGKHGKQISYWLQQGEANLLITSALEPAAHDLVSFVDRHGNTIKSFAVEVDNIEKERERLEERKAILLHSGIEWIEVGTSRAGMVRAKLFDDNEIIFVERQNCIDTILPGFIPFEEELPDFNHIKNIDHIASVVRINESDYWNEYLMRILDLKAQQTIGEEFFENLLTGMKMHVLSSPNKKINKVIVEPLATKKKNSQVDIFLEQHQGIGIQHLAFEVDNLFETVAMLKLKNIKFNPIPENYYQQLAADSPELPIEALKKANILCEKDGDKLLLQIFTEPIGDRPTLFYEFIQRVNYYSGFGANNVRQLFKSMEVSIAGE